MVLGPENTAGLQREGTEVKARVLPKFTLQPDAHVLSTAPCLSPTGPKDTPSQRGNSVPDWAVQATGYPLPSPTARFSPLGPFSSADEPALVRRDQYTPHHPSRYTSPPPAGPWSPPCPLPSSPSVSGPEGGLFACSFLTQIQVSSGWLSRCWWSKPTHCKGRTGLDRLLGADL